MVSILARRALPIYFTSNRLVCCHICRSAAVGKSAETPLLKHLKQKILFKGPITVAEYMKLVLTNANSGYYMHSDVFGAQGDFITSPEISQMFGELLAVWCINEWMRSGSPDQLQVVELGPGRGTLADDMLRVFMQFPGIKDAVSLHLVEVSPFLSTMQYKKLAHTDQPLANENDTLSDGCYQSCISRYNNIAVNWYKQLSDVPKARSFYVAHEFFDALPVHKFQKVDGSWREVLIDIDETETSENHLRFVLAPTDTAASRLLLKVAPGDSRDHIEISPDAGTIITELAQRIAE
jgi:NADH dehydrogenase [ubiquinone] 1 alpha subcomplex assembly factor 7